MWSKHTHICLTSHAMNVLILFTTTDGDSKNDDIAWINEVFSDSISRFISWHNLSIVPVVYPMQLRVEEDGASDAL